MILQPILPWWGLVIMFTPFVVFLTWRIIVSWRKKPERYLWLQRFVVIVLIILISLRPSLPGASRSAGNTLLDVYFAIDTTSSMTAEDYNGSQQRIEGVKQDIKDITKELAGARFSVITFTRNTYQQLPLTSDTSMVRASADTLTPQHAYYGIGSSIDQPIDDLKEELERIKKDNPERGRLIFYLGDGEQTVDKKPDSFESIRPLISGGAVLGYGSTEGGKMQIPRTSDTSPIYYVIDTESDEFPSPSALSKLDEENLKTIASQLDIQYLHRTKPGDIQQITKDIDIGKIVKGSHDSETYDDLYWIVVIPLVMLLGYETWRQLHTTRALQKTHKSGDDR